MTEKRITRAIESGNENRIREVLADVYARYARLGFQKSKQKTRHAPMLKRILVVASLLLVVGISIFVGIRFLDASSTLGGSQGVMDNPTEPAFFLFEFESEKDQISYGDTVSIKLTLKYDYAPRRRPYFLPGDLTVYLEADEGIEIVDQNQYTIENYDPYDSESKYYYRNDYVMEFDFNVKFQREENYLSLLKFRIGFETSIVVENTNGNHWIFGDYFDPFGDYILCYSVAAARGSDGVILAYDTVSGIQEAYYNRIIALVKMLDEEYKNGKITAEKYANLCRSYYKGDILRPIIINASIGGVGDYVEYDCLMYISPDLCAEMLVSNEYRIDAPYDLLFENDIQIIRSARTVLAALRDSGAITQAEYDEALSDVDEKGITYLDNKNCTNSFLYSNFTSTSTISEISQPSFLKSFDRRYIYRNDRWTTYNGGETDDDYSVNVDFGENIHNVSDGLTVTVTLVCGELGIIDFNHYNTSLGKVTLERSATGATYVFSYSPTELKSLYFAKDFCINNKTTHIRLYSMIHNGKLFISEKSWNDARRICLDYLRENDPGEYDRMVSEIIMDYVIMVVQLMCLAIIVALIIVIRRFVKKRAKNNKKKTLY